MASFTTNPVRPKELLIDCEGGILKLPDFQRSWVWDEERMRSLDCNCPQWGHVSASSL